MAKKTLRPEVANKYHIVGIVEAGEINHPKYGVVDLSQVNAQKAAILAKDDSFRYLTAKPENKKTTTK